MVAVHIDIFLNNKIEKFFIYSYSISIILFIISFAAASYYFNLKLIKYYKRKKLLRQEYPILKKSATILLSIFSIVFLYFDIEESLVKLSTIEAFYSQNLVYLNENKYARYLFYSKGAVSIIFSLYIINLIYYFNKITNFEKILILFVIFLYVFSTLLAGNRSSAITAFLILGIVITSRITPQLIRSKILVLQSVIILAGFIFAIILTAQSLDNDLMLSIFVFLERIVLGSDIGYRYHLSSTFIDLSNFYEYNFLYFIKPILVALGIQSSSPGIGPQLLIAAGIDEFGKGPIPTFYYDSFIISKSYVFPMFYSTILGILVPFLRYYALKKFDDSVAKSNLNGLILSIVIFLMCAGPTGDYLSFFNNILLNIISVFFILLIIKISNIRFIIIKNTLI